MKLVKDVILCTVVRDDFRWWLDGGNSPLTIQTGEKESTLLLKLEKSPLVDYLYRMDLGRDGSISWDSLLKFCGAYDTEHQSLYLMEDSLNCLAHGPAPFVVTTGQSMTEELCGRINRHVEKIIANDRSNLSCQKVTDPCEVRNLQYYQEYKAREEAIEMIFNGKTPDGQFHSTYTMEELPETTFMAWLQDPENFIQTEAEVYSKRNQEKFLLQFLKNDALWEEYQAIAQDPDNPLHRVKAIFDAIKTSGAKTVTVTVQKNGEELSFRTGTTPLMGHHNSYNTSHIAAADRQEFERLFGRHASYTAEDITRITYGKKALYEAAPIQAEDMTESIEWGGMSLCYDADLVQRNGLEDALDQVRSIAVETQAYMRQMAAAPPLLAEGLSGNYRLLAEFNHIILAGHERDGGYGVEFITWERIRNGTALWQGHYYDNDFGTAKQDFATRSGLVPVNTLFTKEQLAVIYDAVQNMTALDLVSNPEQGKLLERIMEQLQEAVPQVIDLANVLTQSPKPQRLEGMQQY